ncbi:MAG: hypothetical protein H0X40_09280 [Chthoniobacterales bacterium]|nr:hypothetical protein [Chthoniobacterales bacterium]
MNSARHFLLTCLFCAFTFTTARAGSATWAFTPASGDWNTAANWLPATVPNDPADVATFDVTRVAHLSLSASVQVDSLVFNPGATGYTIILGTSPTSITLTIGGAGIVNNSGIVQNFVVNSLPSNQINFTGPARAGVMTVFTNVAGGNLGLATSEQFFDQSSADHATFISDGNSAQMNSLTPGVLFLDDSTADHAVLIINPGRTLSAQTIFGGNSTAGNATVTANGGTLSHKFGGRATITGTATGGDATITATGSDVAGGTGGFINCMDLSTLGNATVILQGGAVAGGILQLATQSPAGFARIEVFGNGILEVFQGMPMMTIGSLEGDGNVELEGATLTIGGNSLSTTFSGVIVDVDGGPAGAISKVSSTSLELSGANTYSGGTTVAGGTLIASNTTGSATGTGAVTVTAGTLGGAGTISGAVTVGRGSGGGAILAPAHGAKQQATLKILSAVTFDSDSTYICTFKARSNQARTDSITANGVAIGAGASFNFVGQAQGTLRAGLVFKVISNTSANPISGTFANLPDGAILNVNGNSLKANYEGGDGNDLTLTVQ